MKREVEDSIDVISTSTQGGAGIAAVRIAESLNDFGWKVRFLTRDVGVNSPNGAVEVPARAKNFWEEVFQSFRKRLPWFRPKVYPGNYEKISFLSTDFAVENWLGGRLAHLHWVVDFVDFKRFFEKVEVPVVWTLHDMNPFSGLFHYQNDGEMNPHLSSLDQSLRIQKKQIIQQFQHPLHIVTPSKWLKQISEDSPVFQGIPHSVVHNPVPLDVYFPMEKELVCQFLGLEPNKRRLLVVAQSLENRRKGGAILEQVCRLLGSTEIEVVTIGRKNASLEGVKHIGEISDPRLLAAFYNACDFMLLTSLEDNLPNTMVESIACGTPVLGFAVGGVPEILVEKNAGFVAEEVSAESMFALIQDAFSSECDFSHLRCLAEEEFNPVIQAKKYVEIYRNVLKESISNGS